jgi:apolipoprotein N-acyltransferase
MVPLCIVASGIAYALSTGVIAIWPLVWVAPLPILWLALRESRGRTALAAFLAFAIGRIGFLPIALAILPPPLIAVVLIVPPLAFAGVVLASRAVALRLDLRLFALAFPIFWTAWEQLVVAPVGAGAELGFTQASNLPVVQLASLTGVVGVSFVVGFAPALVATILALRARGRAWRWPAAGGGIALAATFVFGILRLAGSPGAPAVRIGVAANDEHIERVRSERAAESLDTVAAYARRADALAKRGAKVVVLPEKLVGVTPAFASSVEDRLGAAARDDGIWLVAGLNRIGQTPPRNVAVVYAPDGSRALEYDKIHLVRGYEDAYVPGTTVGILAGAPGPWAVAVCRDLIVGELARRLGTAGIGLVLDPAWDFVADGPAMSRVARLRAIEGGFALVRAAKQGVPTVSDGYGRALLAKPSAGDVVEVVDVVPGPGGTPYARTGDWFGYACVAAAALLLIARSLGRRRRRHGSANLS